MAIPSALKIYKMDNSQQCRFGKTLKNTECVVKNCQSVVFVIIFLYLAKNLEKINPFI